MTDLGQFRGYELPPYVGERNRKAEADLRLKRLRARAWMREKGIQQIGSKATAVTRLEVKA
jgi:hypothetical protein